MTGIGTHTSQGRAHSILSNWYLFAMGDGPIVNLIKIVFYIYLCF